MTADDRSDILNAIWLCQNCAKLIDSDVKRYTVEQLLEWKSVAESRARAVMGLAAKDFMVPYGELNPEALTILELAAEDGLVYRLETDQTGPFVRAGQGSFVSGNDRAFAAGYLAGLEDLRRRGLLIRESSILFRLTKSAFDIARALQKR